MDAGIVFLNSLRCMESNGFLIGDKDWVDTRYGHQGESISFDYKDFHLHILLLLSASDSETSDINN